MNKPSGLTAESRSLAASALGPPADTLTPLLRRRVQVEPPVPIGTATRQVLSALERAQQEGKSEALLLWPQRPDSVAVFHALSALTRLADCDGRTLLSIFFPWNRNATA